MRKLVMLGLVFGSLFAANIKPSATIEAGGNVQQIALYGDSIIVGTNKGTIEGYKLSDHSNLFKIEFAKIKDFTGDLIAPKVFSVDMLDGSNTFVAVVQAEGGARTLNLIENGKISVLIEDKENLFINKAKFIDKNRILFALMSNELVLFDIATKKYIYQKQINPSHFSDFALNETRTLVASSCESGEITINDVATGAVKKVLKGGNLDNVYKVDFKKNRVLCAGQDRRGIVYDLNSGAYDRFDGSFLIYAGALSPEEKLGAFAFNEKNDIVIFNLATKSKLHTLEGQKSTLNTIVFANEKELVSGSDDTSIMIWRLP